MRFANADLRLKILFLGLTIEDWRKRKVDRRQFDFRFLIADCGFIKTSVLRPMRIGGWVSGIGYRSAEVLDDGGLFPKRRRQNFFCYFCRIPNPSRSRLTRS